jgi:hypothetical protein
MELDQLVSLWDGLKASGRLNEIRGEDGKIRPSDTAIVKVEFEFPGVPEGAKLLLAQTQTLVDLAESYQAEHDSADIDDQT